MRQSKIQIGEELKKELNKGFDIDRISNWALEMSIESRGENDKEVFDVLNSLCLMEMGPEFEYTEEDLKKLSEVLLNEEKDPIKIVNRMRLERINENDLDENI
jgi:hypothetical protein